MPETAIPVEETELSTEGFLRVSGAYLLSRAYRYRLRAAYARHSAKDRVAEHNYDSRSRARRPTLLLAVTEL